MLCMLSDINRVRRGGNFENRSTKNAQDIRGNVENLSNSASPLIEEGLQIL